MSDAPRSHPSRSTPLHSRSQWAPVAVFAVALGLGLFTRWSYLAAPLVLDDLDFFVQIGLVRTGRWPLGFFLIAPQGPHPMALWKLLFYGEWMAFGIDTAGYRVVISAAHAASAAMLFVLLRHYATSLVAAWFGALVFAGAAIGGWDNPLSWIMCGMIPLAMLFFLAGMICVTQLDGPQARRWSLLLAACTAGSLLSWGNMIALLPALPAQYWWLEGAPLDRRRVQRLAWAWLAPYLVVGAVQVALLVPQLGRAERQRVFAPLDVAYRSAGQASVALATLVYGQVVSPEREALAPKLLLAAIALSAAWACAASRLRRLLLLMLVVVAVNLLLVNLGGASVEFASALSSGRYFYIPTLLWSVAGAALADFGARRLRAARGEAWSVVVIALLMAFALHQRVVARETRAQFELVGRPTMTALDAQRVLTTSLAKAANRAQRPLPDLPVLLANPSKLLWTVSMFAAACEPPDMPSAGFAPAESPAVIDPAIALLREMRSPYATVWANLWQASALDFRAAAWLSRYAVSRNKIVRLPKFWFTHGPISYPADQLFAWAFDAPLANVEVTADPGLRPAELIALAEELALVNEPEAQGWSGLLRRLAAEPTMGTTHP